MGIWDSLNSAWNSVTGAATTYGKIGIDKIVTNSVSVANWAERQADTIGTAIKERITNSLETLRNSGGLGQRTTSVLERVGGFLGKFGTKALVGAGFGVGAVAELATDKDQSWWRSVPRALLSAAAGTAAFLGVGAAVAAAGFTAPLLVLGAGVLAAVGASSVVKSIYNGFLGNGAPKQNQFGGNTIMIAPVAGGNPAYGAAYGMQPGAASPGASYGQGAHQPGASGSVHEGAAQSGEGYAAIGGRQHHSHHRRHHRHHYHHGHHHHHHGHHHHHHRHKNPYSSPWGPNTSHAYHQFHMSAGGG